MSKLGERWVRWSFADDQTLMKLCKERVHPGINGLPCISEQDWPYIASHFEGRTPIGCKSHYIDLKRQAEGKPKRCRAQVNPKVVHGANSEFTRSYQEPISLPDPVSITAMIFGDPLPGRSALDRKAQESSHA